MKKIAFLLFTLFDCCSLNVLAQDIDKKLGVNVLHYLNVQKTEASSKSFNDEVEKKVRVVLMCEERNEAEKLLSKMAVDYTIITKSVLTAQVTASQIREIVEWDCIQKITGMDQHFLTNDAARFQNKVDKVYSGTDLETPFTGKGVLIGCVDKGMLYTHPAFWVNEDSTRIIAAFNMSKSTKYTSPSALKSAINDGLNESHATHVMGIAAGGNAVVNTNYYGMAPEANIVAVSSEDFSEADILEGIAQIRNIAKEKGMPCVVNLSLGSSAGTHDGNSDIDHQLDEMSEEGVIFCVSAGNERNDKLHASYDFEESSDTCLIIVKNYESSFVRVDIIGNNEDSVEVIPCFFNPNTNKVKTLTEQEINRCLVMRGEVNSSNGKFYSQNLCYVEELLGNQHSMYYTIFRVKGKPGNRIDAFLNSDNNARYNSMGRTVCARYDGSMSIGDLGDCRSAITVGAYVSKTAWKNISNQDYSVSSSVSLGDIAPFSSVGPMTDPNLLKPNVCAPGMTICSAIDKSSSSFINSTGTVCEKKRFNGKDYYYGMMQGTSMSAPSVSGIVALWLQANPYLTYKHIHQIIKETSVKDLNTGTTVPNNIWGYGKINAYAGLKKALEMLTDVQALKNNESPLTIKKTNDAWHLLLNSQESYLNLSIVSLDGMSVYKRMFRNLRQGEECIVSLTGLSRGIYILNTQTSNSNESRKIIVK